MNKAELQTRNENIATMMGWWKENGQPETWWTKNEIAQYVVYSEYKDNFKEMPFHKRYRFLMMAIEYIRQNIRKVHEVREKMKTEKILMIPGEVFIERFDINLTHINITTAVWNGAEFEYFDERNQIKYEFGEKMIEAIFLAVSDLAEEILLNKNEYASATT